MSKDWIFTVFLAAVAIIPAFVILAWDIRYYTMVTRVSAILVGMAATRYLVYRLRSVTP